MSSIVFIPKRINPTGSAEHPEFSVISENWIWLADDFHSFGVNL